MFKFITPKLQFKVEKWKWSKEYRVYVSTLGNFKDEHKRNIPIKINQNGYCSIRTNLGYRLAHRIVMKTWKSIPDSENLTVDHLNHNKRDNSLSNLEWVTYAENSKRAKMDYVRIDEMPLVKSGINNNIFIYCEDVKLNSLKQAIEYARLIDTSGNLSNASDAAIGRRIKKAIGTNTKYCNKTWIAKGE